jgi:vancomycin resistance protein YoaR
VTSRTETATADPSLGFASARQFGWGQALFGFCMTVAAVGVLAAAFVVGLGEAFAGRAMPGVNVDGVSIAGLDRTAAEARLREQLPSLSSGRLTLSLDGNGRTIANSALGRDYDLSSMLDDAFAVGRQGSVTEQALERLASLARGTTIGARARFDLVAMRAFVSESTTAIGRDPVDAAVRYVPATRDFAVTPSQDGRRVDDIVAGDAVSELLASTTFGDLSARLASERVEPTVTTAEALAARDQAIAMTKSELTLTAEKRTFAVTASMLKTWLRFDATADGGYGPAMDVTKVSKTLKPIAARVDRMPRNAGFKFDGKRATAVTPARTGLQVDVAATAGRIGISLASLPAGAAPKVELAMTVTEPALTTAAAKALQPKLRRLGPGWTTYYPVGIKNFWGRNITIPAAKINGTMLQPGELFDFWKSIEPVSYAAGYGRGGAIINGRTEKTGALAGGICSTSTTMFNAALRAGLELGKRRNHYYYISRYPIGLDATVFKSDGGTTQTMTFRNDTANVLVIRGMSGHGWVRFEIYGVPDGRKVSISAPSTWNYRSASDSVVYTTRLAPGVRERVESPITGFDASRSRTVYAKDGTVLHRDTWFSRYAAITGIVEVGATRASPTQPSQGSGGTGDAPG